MSYWQEFLTIAIVHLLAVASPGPDFAIVLRHSIRFGRRVALWTSLGIGCGILIHVAYSVFGLALVIKTTPWLLRLLTTIAACYLLWLGISAVRASAQPTTSDVNASAGPTVSDKKAFSIGFMTNGLNPKATLFFLSLFTVVVSTQTPFIVKVIYGVYLSIATTLWFCLLSVALSSGRIRDFIAKYSHWFDRGMGVVLIFLALRLLWSEWLFVA